MNGLDKLMNVGVEEGVFPGACIGVVTKTKDGFKTYVNSYGNKSLFPVEKNSIDTVYDMASCTKMLSTVSSLLLLIEQGKISLYDAVVDFIPEFIHKDMRVIDLVTHTAGLPPMLRGSHEMSKEDIINGILNIERKQERQKEIIYSDVGFVLLGWVIEKASGTTLDKFLSKNILKPLHMNHSGFNPECLECCAPTEKRKKGFDKGWVHDEMAKNLGGVCGHAGLFSTINDVCNYSKMILNEGIFDGKKIFSKRGIELLYTPLAIDDKGNSCKKGKRSLGWIIDSEYSPSGSLCSKETIGHTGFTGTSIFIDRKNEVSVIILSNRVHPTRENKKILSFRRRVANFVMANLEEFK